jgi:hypothetical protein
MVYVYSTMKITLQTKIGVFYAELGARPAGETKSYVADTWRQSRTIIYEESPKLTA